MTTAKTASPTTYPTLRSIGDGPVPPGTSSVGMYLIPAGYSWDNGWRLTQDMTVEVRITSEAVLLFSHTLGEFGAGNTLCDAIQDFLTMMSDYRESSQRREDRLPPDEQEKLKLLRKVLEPVVPSVGP